MSFDDLPPQTIYNNKCKHHRSSFSKTNQVYLNLGLIQTIYIITWPRVDKIGSTNPHVISKSVKSSPAGILQHTLVVRFLSWGRHFVCDQNDWTVPFVPPLRTTCRKNIWKLYKMEVSFYIALCQWLGCNHVTIKS